MRTPADKIDTLVSAAHEAAFLRPLLGDAPQAWFDHVERALIDRMVAAKPTDDEARRDAALELHAIRKVRQMIAATVAAGDYANKKLELT